MKVENFNEALSGESSVSDSGGKIVGNRTEGSVQKRMLARGNLYVYVHEKST
jgi:hypothetical protein